MIISLYNMDQLAFVRPEALTAAEVNDMISGHQPCQLVTND
jgi:hypothetical protein